MDKKLVELIEEIGGVELEEEEVEKIEEALSEKMLIEFKESLETFDETTLEGVEEIAVSKLTQIIIKLATKEEEKEEEEEEEGGKKKVKKSPSWGFTLVPPKED